MQNDKTYEVTEGHEAVSGQAPQIQWLELIARLWKHKKQIVAFVVLVTALSFGFTFLLTPRYTARTSILPELSKERALGLAGLSSLAEATGLNVGETPVSKLYPMIIKSERILRAAIYEKYETASHVNPITLADYWEIDSKDSNAQIDKTLRLFRERMDVSFDMRLGTVTLEIEMEEAQLAADVANRITQELDDYTRTKRRTNASLQREFIEERIGEVEKTLERSEVTLKEFRERNRRVADSPQLLLEQERLSRDLEINSTIFIELKKQLEVAKIEEIKNISLINVLDAARPPVRRSYPVRREFALFGFFGGVLAALAYALGRNNIVEKLHLIKMAAVGRTQVLGDAVTIKRD